MLGLKLNQVSKSGPRYIGWIDYTISINAYVSYRSVCVSTLYMWSVVDTVFTQILLWWGLHNSWSVIIKRVKHYLNVKYNTDWYYSNINDNNNRNSHHNNNRTASKVVITTIIIWWMRCIDALTPPTPTSTPHPPDTMTAISLTTFWNAFLMNESFVFRFRIH